MLLKATGQSMLKTVKLAEILKRKIQGLHQINKVTRTQEEKIYIPLEEGLDEVVLMKDITILEIILTKNPNEKELKLPGYQPPHIEGDERLSLVSVHSSNKEDDKKKKKKKKGKKNKKESQPNYN